MTTPRSRETTATSLSQDLLYMTRYYLGGRRGLLILAGLVLAAGLVLNWSWLVAVGIAPILIAVLPCVAMCALGLCMSRAGGRSCSTARSEEHTSELQSLMRISYAVFCLKKKKKYNRH